MGEPVIAPTLNVVPMREYTLCDASAVLRKIADGVDAGEFSAVGEVAVVIMGTKLTVHGFGVNQDGTSTAAILQAGALQMIRDRAPRGRSVIALAWIWSARSWLLPVAAGSLLLIALGVSHHSGGPNRGACRPLLAGTARDEAIRIGWANADERR
jgi:hypothetical protein